MAYNFLPADSLPNNLPVPIVNKIVDHETAVTKCGVVTVSQRDGHARVKIRVVQLVYIVRIVITLAMAKQAYFLGHQC